MSIMQERVLSPPSSSARRNSSQVSLLASVLGSNSAKKTGYIIEKGNVRASKFPMSCPNL
jgi:hypothetical protein